jgi:hypothetical protein
MTCSRCKKESICQSCAMPLKNKADFGSNADGSKNLDYCGYCFSNGKFSDPSLTKEAMGKKVEAVMKGMNIEQSKIEETKALLPRLKRWK